MKATLSLEYIGESQDARLAMCHGITREVLGAEVANATFGPSRPRKPWVAEITGKDAKFGFARHFLPANWQRKRANSAHSRGVELWFVLESGHFYEVKSPVSWQNSERYFCTVTDDGSIVHVGKEEVDQWLNSRLA